VLARFGVVGFDFFADSRVLLLENRLPSILHPVMEMHLTSVTGYNGARSAGGYGEEHKQGPPPLQEEETEFHGVKIFSYRLPARPAA
jgi:hypothetical protein